MVYLSLLPRILKIKLELHCHAVKLQKVPLNKSVKRLWQVESVQDFLIKLGIKPLMHLLEVSTYTLNNVIVRLTKIMNSADKNRAHF